MLFLFQLAPEPRKLPLCLIQLSSGLLVQKEMRVLLISDNLSSLGVEHEIKSSA